jgi:hypothetical protein
MHVGFVHKKILADAFSMTTRIHKYLSEDFSNET